MSRQSDLLQSAHQDSADSTERRVSRVQDRASFGPHSSHEIIGDENP